ncbi:MAG TPA: tetratricopeptide repeat protein, partial [Acetobacteraceae bacterium]
MRTLADQSGAEAWAADIDTLRDTIERGRVLYLGDPVKKTALQYCREGTQLAFGGEIRLALRTKSKALYLAEQNKDFMLSAECARGVAEAYALVGDNERALSWAQEAERYFGRSGTPTESPRAREFTSDLLALRGNVALADGNPADAVVLLQQALEKSPPGARVRILVSLANALAATGETAQALSLLADAEQAATPAFRATAERSRGDILLAAGKRPDAVAVFRNAADAATRSGDDYTLAWADRGIGQAERALGHPGEAAAAYAAALATAERLRAVFHSEEFRSGTFGSLQDIFDEAIDLAMA